MDFDAVEMGIALPKEALKYMLVHELAHIATKRHTKKFWKIVETVYPEFKIGQKLLAEYGKTITSEFFYDDFSLFAF